MPKMKNVSRGDIQKIMDESEGPILDMHDLADRIEKGYCDEITDLASIARHFNAVSRTAGNMVSVALTKLSLQEQRRELEIELRKRTL